MIASVHGGHCAIALLNINRFSLRRGFIMLDETAVTKLIIDSR
jgi:hypothetical protein